MQNISRTFTSGDLDLLIEWTSRIIRARYKQSILGGLWAIIQPAATVVIFTIIFTQFIPIDTGDTPYILFSYTAMVPWLLFSGSVTDMVDSLVINMHLVTKIYFPREIFVIAALLARVLDFAIAFGLLVLVILLNRVFVDPVGWLSILLLLMLQLFLSLGLGLFGAALNVFYRDIKHVIKLALQLWFYATPIIYPSTLVPKRFHTMYFLNPMAGVIESYRSVLLDGKLPTSNLLLSAAVSILFLVFGFWFFRRVEHLFADVI
jgi:lipopolysaccharide transport system permease protein